MAMNPESDVLSKIGELERDAVDDIVDWQLSDSPAAHMENGPLALMGWFDTVADFITYICEILNISLPSSEADIAALIAIVATTDEGEGE